METVQSDAPAARGRLYRMLWRWHFYAGLVCIPVVIWLAVTGSLYLFRPQVEAWIDRDYAALQRTGAPASMERIVGAATAAVPGSKLAGVVLPEHPDQAARILVSANGERTRVYVHPDTLAILKTVPDDGRFERVLAHLHGELLVGRPGSVVVELAASWAIVMILTGLYLWWPRNARGLAGVVYPRLGDRKRFWRDIHAVTGVWISGLALFLIATGLPWAFVWGESFKAVRQWTGTAPISQDWTTSSTSEHAEHRHADMMAMAPAATDASLDAIYATAIRQNLAAPVLLAPPARGQTAWMAKSNAQNRTAQRSVAISAATAEPVGEAGYGQKHVIDRIVGFGISAHEGQLFGPLNQALGVVAALGLITLCVSAFVMWRKRAPDGVLGAPPPIPEARIGWGLGAMILIAALLLPVLGGSLIVIALVERLALSRWPAARRWLGLAA
jgi:uncharacterized iron-regulated membrane protein